MTKKTLGALALSTLAVSLLSGCASIQDQIAKQVASSVVNQATGGKVSMSDQNGNITVKDNQGNVANIGGGAQRPSSVPSDLPSLPGATTYGWFGSSQGGIFSFSVANPDYNAVCDQMVTMIKASGWSDNPNGFNMEVQGTKSTMYQKTGFALTLACSSDNNGKVTQVTLAKSQDTSSGTTTTTPPAPTTTTTTTTSTSGTGN